MGSSHLEAVIFDWGGTLSDYAVVEFEQLWRRAAGHLAPGREDEVAAQLTAIELAFWERTATHARSGTLADLIEEAASALGREVGQAVREEAALLYLDAWSPHIKHDADAAPVLEALRARGLKIGLLSNTHWPRAYHEEFLERDGLVALIDQRIYTSEIAYMKPHPEAFAAALDALGVRDPARAVFVGDRPFDDILGAHGAGMRAVLRRNPAVPAHEVEPDATIDSLPELLGHLERWDAS